jgi:hypothetical protein
LYLLYSLLPGLCMFLSFLLIVARLVSVFIG